MLLLILWHLYTSVRANVAVNYRDVQMKISRLLFFLCSYSACKEEHHHVRSLVKVKDRETEHRTGSQVMAGAVSFRPCVEILFLGGGGGGAGGHFGLICRVGSSFFPLFINLYHYGRVGQYGCVRVVTGGFRQTRVWRDVVGRDRLGKYTQGMVVYLPGIGKRREGKSR